MDRLELKHHLRAAGVPEDCYLLVGLDPPRSVREGARIVRPNQHSWEVLVWSPVAPHPVLTFSNEDEACEYLLNTLTAVRAAPGTVRLVESVSADARRSRSRAGSTNGANGHSARHGNGNGNGNGNGSGDTNLAPSRQGVAEGQLVPQEA